MHLIPPRLRAQIVKELLSILRDPRARFILIGPPLLQLLVFSFAATLEVSNVTLAVYDRDGGRWAQELVASLGAASFVGTLRQVLAGRPSMPPSNGGRRSWPWRFQTPSRAR
jgi:ABC-2 type transport system permease protein